MTWTTTPSGRRPPLRMSPGAALALVIAVATSAAGLAATGRQSLQLQEVLFRASQAIVAYQKVLDGVVAEERYDQQVLGRDGDVRQTRALVSRFLFLRPPEQDTWVGVRDVFEVDGKHVGNPEDQFAGLLRQPGKLAEGLSRIARESARHVLGDITHTLSVPTVGLVFLHPLHQYRCDFEKEGEETVEGVSTWRIRFSEQHRPTFIRSGRLDMFARGVFWLDPETGDVARTQLTLGDQNTRVKVETTVAYGKDPVLGIPVPLVMEETYSSPGNEGVDLMRGVARYSSFRRISTEAAGRGQEPK